MHTIILQDLIVSIPDLCTITYFDGSDEMADSDAQTYQERKCLYTW